MTIERCAVVTVALLLAAPTRAQAPDEASIEADPPSILPASAVPATGEVLLANAIAAFQAGDLPQALALVEADLVNAPLPTVGLWHARVLAKMGRLLEADERYGWVVAIDPATIGPVIGQLRARGLRLDDPAPEAQHKSQEGALAEREELQERIPTLEVQVIGADARPTVDGAPINGRTRMNPGTYRIEAAAEGRSVAREIVLAERDEAVVALDLRAPPPLEDPGATQRVVGWVAVAVGSGAVAIGSVIGVIALVQYAGSDCPDDVCPASEFDQADAYNALRIPAGVSIIVGGAVALGGVGLLLSAPSDPRGEQAHVDAVVAPGFVGLRGSF